MLFCFYYLFIIDAINGTKDGSNMEYHHSNEFQQYYNPQNWNENGQNFCYNPEPEILNIIADGRKDSNFGWNIFNNNNNGESSSLSQISNKIVSTRILY